MQVLGGFFVVNVFIFLRCMLYGVLSLKSWVKQEDIGQDAVLDIEADQNFVIQPKK